MSASEPAAAKGQAGKKRGNSSYSAPALEKGLDILEMISLSPTGLTQLQIARNLERTPTEIFRMLSVLETREYLARDADGTYQLTLKLFELSHRYPPTKKLLASALPVMELLTQQTRQSVHLVVYHQSQVLVIAQADSPEPMGFSVKLGAHFQLHPDRTSGRVLTAFVKEAQGEHMFQQMLENAKGSISAKQLRKELSAIRKAGLHEARSRTTAGVVDISCPIFDHTRNVAAVITVPFVAQSNIEIGIEAVKEYTLAASRLISTALGFPNGRSDLLTEES